MLLVKKNENGSNQNLVLNNYIKNRRKNLSYELLYRSYSHMLNYILYPNQNVKRGSFILQLDKPERVKQHDVHTAEVLCEFG